MISEFGLGLPGFEMKFETENHEFGTGGFVEALNEEIKKAKLKEVCLMSKNKKTGEFEYVLFDKKRTPFYAHKNYEEISTKILALKLLKEK